MKNLWQFQTINNHDTILFGLEKFLNNSFDNFWINLKKFLNKSFDSSGAETY